MEIKWKKIGSYFTSMEVGHTSVDSPMKSSMETIQLPSRFPSTSMEAHDNSHVSTLMVVLLLFG